MTDIAERLRAAPLKHWEEAADTIERLQAEVERLRAAHYDILGSTTDKQAAAISRRALEPKPVIAPCDDAEFGMKP